LKNQSSSWTVCNAADASFFYLPAFHVRVTANGDTHWPLFHDSLARLTASGLPPNWSLSRTLMVLTGDWGTCRMDATFSEALWATHFGLHTDVNGVQCHRKDRYLVLPSHIWRAREMIEHSRARRGESRQLLFTYYGTPHGNGGPARNATISRWAGRLSEGFSVGIYTEEGRSMSDDILNSTFCGAPHGAGWGSRLSYCVLHGSIPVIMQARPSLTC
jgi:hypothetical protein